MSTPGYGIEIEGMSAWYGRVPAVRNLSMHVPRGSIYGLVGPTGAGKSTTIRALATLQQANTGTVVVDGIDVRSDPAGVRRRVGYLPDVSGVYENLTVSEYLDFYGSIYRLPPRRRVQLTDELLDLINLVDQRNTPVKNLPRGMKQQLGVARCLIHDPPVLLLDEPASGMDPPARIELREILQELARLGKTILISSHILSELSEVCTHMGILRDGELLAEGPTDEMIGLVVPAVYLRVRVLDPRKREPARQLLEERAAFSQIGVEGPDTLIVQFEGTEGDLAAMLDELIGAGVQVTEFALQRPTLEEWFSEVIEMRGQA